MPVKKARSTKPVRKTRNNKKRPAKKLGATAKRLAGRHAKKRQALKTREIAGGKPPLREPVPEPEVEIVEIVTTEVQEYPLGSLLIEEEAS